MDNTTGAFIREAHHIGLDPAERAEIRSNLIRTLGLGSLQAGAFALQPATVPCAR